MTKTLAQEAQEAQELSEQCQDFFGDEFQCVLPAGHKGGHVAYGWLDW